MARGCLHTTEGYTIDGAIGAMDGDLQSGKPTDPCKFVTGQGRIVQTRPFGVQDASLHAPANTYFDVQIEMVCKTDETHGTPPRPIGQLWLPPDSTLKPTVALIAWLAQQGIVPLVVPNNWPDTIDDVKPYPSCNNSRRLDAMRLGLWPHARGWWQHLEVPFQGPTWHWNCGGVKRTVMLQQAQALIGTP